MDSTSAKNGILGELSAGFQGKKNHQDNSNSFLGLNLKDKIEW